MMMILVKSTLILSMVMVKFARLGKVIAQRINTATKTWIASRIEAKNRKILCPVSTSTILDGKKIKRRAHECVITQVMITLMVDHTGCTTILTNITAPRNRLTVMTSYAAVMSANQIPVHSLKPMEELGLIRDVEAAIVVLLSLQVPSPGLM